MDRQLRAIIDSAIAQEEVSYGLYRRLAKTAIQAETKEILECLAKEELEQKTFLQSCFTPEGCKLVSHPRNAHLVELLETPALTPGMSPQEALIVAMKREEVSYNFYRNLAELQPPGETRDSLEKMAQVELLHKNKVEYLYANKAFPEVW